MEGRRFYSLFVSEYGETTPLGRFSRPGGADSFYSLFVSEYGETTFVMRFRSGSPVSIRCS